MTKNGSSLLFQSDEDRAAWEDAVYVKAVDDISLDIYHNQITCLLGKNGAGNALRPASALLIRALT
jgi:ABC-type Na+ transport system ATPase subunit NatA